MPIDNDLTVDSFDRNTDVLGVCPSVRKDRLTFFRCFDFCDDMMDLCGAEESEESL